MWWSKPDTANEEEDSNYYACGPQHAESVSKDEIYENGEVEKNVAGFSDEKLNPPGSLKFTLNLNNER